jgi:thiaminase
MQPMIIKKLLLKALVRMIKKIMPLYICLTPFCLAEIEILGKHFISSSTSRFEEVCKTFEQATRLEVMFWEMGEKLC